MKPFLLILFLLLIFIPSVSSDEIKKIDTNGDQKTDKWLYLSNSRLVKLEEDFNFDGIVDKRADFFYKNGQKIRVEIDSNMDGSADGWSYHKNNIRYLIKSDTNYDGLADYVIDNSTKITMIDSNYDGRMDIHESDHKRTIDANYDGQFEREEDAAIDLENWLAQERPDYYKNLQKYMRNTNYRQKTGLE